MTEQQDQEMQLFLAETRLKFAEKRLAREFRLVGHARFEAEEARRKAQAWLWAARLLFLAAMALAVVLIAAANARLPH